MEDEIAIVFERTEEGYSRRDIEKRRKQGSRKSEEKKEIRSRKKMEKANSDYDKSQKMHAQSLVKLVARKIELEKMEEENKALRKEVRK